MFPHITVVIVMTFPPDALHTFTGTMPSSDLPDASVVLALLSLVQLTLFLKDSSGSPELPLIHNVQHAMLYNPEAALQHLSDALHYGGFQEDQPVALLV